MANRTSIFNVGLLDDLHNYFPDLLYNSGRFNTVQDVLSYVQSQTRSRFNLFDYGARQYSHEIPPAHTENVVIQPNNPTSARCTCSPFQRNGEYPVTRLTEPSNTCPTCMPPEILTPQRPAPVLTTTVLPPPPIISRNRPRTHFSPTLFYTQESELLEPPPSTSELSAMNSLLSLFSMPMGQTIYNTMENVVIRPTNAQIASATTIVPSIDTSDSTCSVCQELIEPNIPVRRINQCEHQFHKACIDRWFERSVRCPMCRLDIRDNGIQLQGGTGSTE
jgi:hypothetical protein